MKCPICNNELVGKQKYCSPNCRKKSSRSVTSSVTENVTVTMKNGASVTLPTQSVTEPPRSVTSVASDNYDLQWSGENSTLKDDWTPTKVSSSKPITPNIYEWEKTRESKQLEYNLEKLSVKELEKQGYYIPNWKLAGYKNKREVLDKFSLKK